MLLDRLVRSQPTHGEGKMPRTNKQLRARPGYAHLTQWLADPACPEAKDPIWAPRDLTPGHHCIIFQHRLLRNASPSVRLGRRIAAYHHTTKHRHHFATSILHPLRLSQPPFLWSAVIHPRAERSSPDCVGLLAKWTGMLIKLVKPFLFCASAQSSSSSSSRSLAV